MEHLHKKKCIPCEKKSIKTLSADKISDLLSQIPIWQINKHGDKIYRTFKFKDFIQGLDFVNAVADISESEGHHPNIEIDYSTVTLTLWTHSINNLSENDFILAAKIDTILNYHPLALE